MNGRYVKLFTLPENLYAENSPVIISAGALLKDSQSGKVLIQLKIKNISTSQIKALKTTIEQFDTAGNSIGSNVEYEYLDLSVERNAEFGQKTPIMLTDASTRSVKVSVTKVVFSNNDIWNFDNSEWRSLKFPKTLEKTFNDDIELAKQYRLKYGKICKFTPIKDRDIWICSCGAINKNEEKECHKCKSCFDVLNSFDLQELKKDKTLRIENEKKLIEEQKEQTKALKVKTIKITSVIVPLILVATVIIVLFLNFMSQKSLYNNAIMLRESGEFEQAISIFENLQGFKDSEEQIIETKYELVLINFEIYEENNDVSNFTTTMNLLEELGDYKDCEILLTKLKKIKSDNDNIKMKNDYEEGIKKLKKTITILLNIFLKI